MNRTHGCEVVIGRAEVTKCPKASFSWAIIVEYESSPVVGGVVTDSFLVCAVLVELDYPILLIHFRVFLKDLMILTLVSKMKFNGVPEALSISSWS